ncbi:MULTISPECIES: acyl-CoA dehydrogenase family protein [Parafrankia]|uniref:acyl-CoA dehydrogenase family protein n=1 Tax=Parafrankia TaxID=2994362 RepID=UPI00036BD15B|nr:acyl-CoA dehydrogenase family protein [Parafrankia elaeagni]
MHFELTPDQEQLRAGARELARSFGDDYWAEKDQKVEFPWEFYNAFAEGGWLGIAIPTEFGGGGLGITEAALLLEEIAASGAGMNGCSTMHLTIFGLNTIVKHGSADLQKEILPSAADGSLHVCFGVTEPNAGTDTTSITTFAEKVDGGYVINGRKVWITKAGDSQKMILITRTTKREDVTRSTDGMTLFLIDIDREKIDLRAIPKMGRNAVSSYEVFIDNLFVPESARIGEEGKGFKYLLDGLNPERILLAHEALGIGRAALEKATRYAKERVVFGRPIGKNQGVAFPLAEAQIRLDAAELMARQAAWRYDQGLPCGQQANSAKWLCAEAGFQAADQAIQTHGGMGYAREYHVERYFRESRIMRLAPVSQEMVLNYVSQHVLGLPKSY